MTDFKEIRDTIYTCFHGKCDECRYYHTNTESIAREILKCARKDTGNYEPLCMKIMLMDVMEMIDKINR